jgi:hypothetical protein
MGLALAFCNLSVAPVRTEPNHRAEQSTQLLFGEKAEILEVNNRDWARVRSAWDGYEGWCPVSQLTKISKKDYLKKAKHLAATHVNKLVLPEGEILLPLGSELASYKSGKIPADKPGRFKGKKLNIKSASLDCESLKAAALKYMYAPYQWGGRAIGGIDCSGLMQMAFKLCNHPIPRDASQQAKQGWLVDFLQHAQCGDMAFFDDKEGRIVHVGLLLDNQNIIHATDTSGRVVIDRIDQAGIISVQLKKRTHNLRMVRRLIPQLPAQQPLSDKFGL